MLSLLLLVATLTELALTIDWSRVAAHHCTVDNAVGAPRERAVAPVDDINAPLVLLHYTDSVMSAIFRKSVKEVQVLCAEQGEPCEPLDDDWAAPSEAARPLVSLWPVATTTRL